MKLKEVDVDGYMERDNGNRVLLSSAIYCMERRPNLQIAYKK